jgi:Acetoacetate decarboxylase (ADC)
MGYRFIPKARYRMPTHFGPSLGPRQGVDGRRYLCIDSPNVSIVQATFNADAGQLKKILPPCFVLREPYSVNFTFEYLTNVEWLAGRGYNTFGVSIPVSFMGEEDILHGDLLLVIWENMADCIITGREDLGVAKIYCELPQPQLIGNGVICQASWDGVEIANLKLSGVSEIPIGELPDAPPTDGTFHYKYIPKTGIPDEADAEYAVLLPSDWPNVVVDEMKIASGAQIQFRHSTWEELPTLVHIVNTLADLSLGECIDASWISIHGGKDLSDMRIIR